MTDDVIRRTGVDRSDRLFGPNFFAIDHERIFLSELRAHVRECVAHAVLILFVSEIHKWRVFISITGRRVEGSAVAANIDMARAVWTLGDETCGIAQQL